MLKDKKPLSIFNTGIPVQKYPSAQNLPFGNKERARIADMMSFEQINNTTLMIEDKEKKKKRKWKEIRHLWSLIQLPEYSHGNIENALWIYGNQISSAAFVNGIMAEFNFEKTNRVENNLRWIYSTFDLDNNENVDWRDVMSALKIIILFRMVKSQPKELLLKLFDIYSYSHSEKEFSSTKKTLEFEKQNSKIEDGMNWLLKIFSLVCETDTETERMEDILIAEMKKPKPTSLSSNNSDLENRSSILSSDPNLSISFPPISTSSSTSITHQPHQIMIERVLSSTPHSAVLSSSFPLLYPPTLDSPSLASSLTISNQKKPPPPPPPSPPLSLSYSSQKTVRFPSPSPSSTPSSSPSTRPISLSSSLPSLHISSSSSSSSVFPQFITPSSPSPSPSPSHLPPSSRGYTPTLALSHPRLLVDLPSSSSFSSSSSSFSSSSSSFSSSPIDSSSSLLLLPHFTRAPRSLSRKSFSSFLSNSPHLLAYWQRLAWDKLPSECKLLATDESQIDSVIIADEILYQFKSKQAKDFFAMKTLKHYYKEWVIKTNSEKRISFHLMKKYKKKRRIFFLFWNQWYKLHAMKRKKALLAQVMGNYAMIGRCFHRIRLYNFNENRLKKLNNSTTLGKSYALAKTHLREYQRIHSMKLFFHRWWNICVDEINSEVIQEHNFIRLLKPIVMRWKNYTQQIRAEEKMEFMVRENKLKFDLMMKETDEAIAELVMLEKKREEKIQLKEEEKKKQEKEEKFEKSKKARQMEKLADKRLILRVQRDARKKRIKKEMSLMKKKHEKYWKFKKEERIEAAKKMQREYIADPENAIKMRLKFNKFKETFFAPPRPETKEQEARLSSKKNIIFLFLEGKLQEKGLELRDVIFKFDKKKKGYLTYEEFTHLVESLNVGLNPVEIKEVIKSVDVDGDGGIDMKELQDAMNELVHLGVLGSPWRMYVDPAQDVICYHNFQTNEKILEYKMTDEKLMEILHCDMIQGAEYTTNKLVDQEDVQNWNEKMRNYMACRLQRMYYVWSARQKRKRVSYKLLSRKFLKEKSTKSKVVSFIEWCFVGLKTRSKFKRELHMTYEKIWDTTTQSIFWFNHRLQTSTWERPKLLWRYGDVCMPSPWVATDVLVQTVMTNRNTPSARPGDPPSSSSSSSSIVESEGMYALHYWHVKAQRDLPRKPDGLPLCHYCQRNLAIHFCKDCQIDYCPTCLRMLHQSPFGFLQNEFPTPEQLIDSSFLQQYSRSKTHSWKISQPKSCEQCHSDKILAGVRCQTCELDLCRPCFRRIHEHVTFSSHESFYI